MLKCGNEDMKKRRRNVAEVIFIPQTELEEMRRNRMMTMVISQTLMKSTTLTMPHSLPTRELQHDFMRTAVADNITSSTLVTDYNYLQLGGFVLISSVIVFLLLSYTCHMVSVFGSPHIHDEKTSYYVRLSKAIRAFSHVNTVKIKNPNYSTPLANKRIATASRQIAMAMSQIMSPASIDSRNITWYNSMDQNTNRFHSELSVTSNNYATLDEFYASQLIDTSNLEQNCQKLRAGDNFQALEAKNSVFSNNMSYVAESCISEHPNNSPNAMLFSSQTVFTPVTTTTSTATSNSLKNCEVTNHCQFSNESIKPVESSVNSTGSHKSSREHGLEKTEIMIIDEGIPRTTCRRTSSLPHLDKFEISKPSLQGFLSGSDQAQSETAGSSDFNYPQKKVIKPTTLAYSTVSTQFLSQGQLSLNEMELPGVDNYRKHHKISYSQFLSPCDTPGNSGSNSVSDVYMMKQQQFKRSATIKRYGKKKKDQQEKGTHQGRITGGTGFLSAHRLSHKIF